VERKRKARRKERKKKKRRENEKNENKKGIILFIFRNYDSQILFSLLLLHNKKYNMIII
jgi:hypothetical protein